MNEDKKFSIRIGDIPNELPKLEKRRDSLQNYYYANKIKNIYYPIRPENYPKVEPSVITITGLEYFSKLKRKFIIDDSSLAPKEYATLGGLWYLYALTNKKTDELAEWESYILRVAIPSKGERPSFKELRENNYATKNPNYDPKQIKFQQVWEKTLLLEMTKLSNRIIFFSDVITKTGLHDPEFD